MISKDFWKVIDRPIVGLSPMDGVTDASFRFIVARHGRPDLIFTEFVNVETAFFAPDAFIKDLTYGAIERPVIAQVYGRDPELFYRVAHVVCELGFDGLDINMGCPAKKVAAKGSGGGLIKTPDLARRIMRAARAGIEHWVQGQTLLDIGIPSELIQKVKAANRLRSGYESPAARLPIPVSVKTRIGYERNSVESWIPALLAEEPAAITIHGRTLAQGYKGSADWEAIARAVEIAAGSPTVILGNGDLRDMDDVVRRVRETGVDGVLLGRAAQGNPWIFTEENAAPGLAQRFTVMLEHARHFEHHWGSERFVAMRKHLAWYCFGLSGAAALRAQLVRVDSVDDVVRCLRAYASAFDLGFEPALP
ncbi:MAG TPA: tRNA-dihydrouridine synthase [Candidatus Eisenbacteria bacterium]|nr:tRNA-dihydrouridine synthase [Candidatus Eisenbacteria bacterium]